jgi:hypothetical protein
MNSLLEVLFNIYTFFSFIPALVGIFLFRKLLSPIRILVVLQIINNCITITSNLFAYYKFGNSHSVFYLFIFFNSIILAIFFKDIFLKKPALFFAFPVFISAYLIIDLILFGKKDMNILPYIFIDIFVIVCCIIYLNFNKKNQKPIRFIVNILLVYFVYDVLFNFATSYFYNYLGDKAFNLIWNIINPIVGIIYYVFLSFALYLALQKAKPSFDEMPDFK